ncbi:MAG: LCP family protein [Nitriliruptoraceae bacterium]
MHRSDDPEDPTAAPAAVEVPRTGRGFLALRVLGGASLVAAFAVAVLAGVVVALDGSLTRVEVEGLGADAGIGGDGAPATVQVSADDSADDSTDDRADGPEPLTVLLLGSDSREVLTPEERIELGTGMAWGERTEVNALLRLDADAGELRMVNVPRDAVVTLCDGSRGRINAAFGIGERTGVGGLSCVVQTLTAWSGLTIDHAVLADFRGFVDIVDALGGIEMYIEEPLRDRRANLDLQAGCQVLDGADALAFVRARSIDDDFGRISRQQRLLAELRTQLAEDGILTDPVRTLRFAEATAASLRVDSTLSLNRIRQLATEHRRTLLQPLETRTVPGTPDTSGEAWLLRPDEAVAAELFTWLLEGDPEPPPTAPSSPGTPDPERDAGAGETDGTGGSPAGPSAGASGADDGTPDDAPRGSRPQRCP